MLDWTHMPPSERPSALEPSAEIPLAHNDDQSSLETLKQEDRAIRAQLETADFPDDAHYLEGLQKIEAWSQSLKDPYTSGVERARKLIGLQHAFEEITTTTRGRLSARFAELESEIELATTDIERIQKIPLE